MWIKMNLDSTVAKVLNRFKEASIEAYVVGGYIRDLLLNKKSFDVDICFSGDVESVIELFAESTVNTNALKFHSVSFTIGDYNFECTHLRVEGPSYNHRHPSTIYLTCDINEDVKRRDFTINGIYYHLDQGIIDPCLGVMDLKNRRLRTIIDAKSCFNEDYLRVFRGIRFQSQLGFEFEAETQIALTQSFQYLTDFPVGWWEKEFIKTLMGSYFLKMAMDQPKFFDALFGHYMNAYYFDQRNPYHQYTLYEHSMRVVAEVKPDVCLKLAALFHDLGKLFTEEHDERGISHYRGHAEVSASLAMPLVAKFTLKKSDQKKIYDLIQYHGIQMNPGFSTVYQLAFQYGYDLMLDIIEIKRADNMSKSEKAYYQVEKCQQFKMDMIRIKEEQWPLCRTDLQVNGHDCKKLGIENQDISRVLNKVLEITVMNEVGNDVIGQHLILQEVIANDLY